MKCSLKVLLPLAAFAVILNTASAGWGIKGIYVFGDSLSDSGNAAILSENAEVEEEPEAEGEEGEVEEPAFPLELYYEGRASNGPVWIEIAAEAYGYEVEPALDGGRNFAFIGAESGTGLSDQETPNFLQQVALFQEARGNKDIKNVHPKDLFVVWVGINDFLRILDESGEITPEDIETVLANIEEGILALSAEKARLFLVPNMPAVHLTPFAVANGLEELMLQLATDFNEGLEELLAEIEADPKITIYRLDVFGLLEAIHETPEAFGLENVSDPLILNLPGEEPEEAPEGDEVVDDGEGDGDEEESTDYGYLYWDDFHPTVEGHLLIAQAAMDIIPIGSWWGRSVARGPDGTAFLGMGWVDDNHWPWVYSYSFNDGEWMWVYDEAGDPDGFYTYIPKSTKWIWLNAMSGWYFDYEAGQWKPVEEDEEEVDESGENPEDPDDDEDPDDEEEDDDDDDTPTEG